jgi:hypothetical protein
MKKSFKILLSSLVLLLAFSSCDKDENQVTFDKGKSLVLTSTVANNATLTLAKADKDLPLLTLNWTNPDYYFNNGISSQDVKYAVQVKAGGLPYKTVTVVAKDLSKVFTQGEINGYISAPEGLDLAPDVTYTFQIRIKSFLGLESETNATNKYSNEYTYTAKTYNVDPDLWITGDATASNWTNTPPANQKFTYTRATKKFTISISLSPGKFYKFLTKQGFWQPQWGGCGASGGDISENPGGGTDPNAIPTPATAGTYLITVDLNAKKCTVQ